MAKAENKTSAEDRDAQLRRRMLNVARLSRGFYQAGFVPFRLLAGAKDDEGLPCADDECVERLITDLLEWGLLEEAGAIGIGGTRPTNRDRRFKLTHKGQALWERHIDPIPGVDDDRLH